MLKLWPIASYSLMRHKTRHLTTVQHVLHIYLFDFLFCATISGVRNALEVCILGEHGPMPYLRLDRRLTKNIPRKCH